MLLDINDLLGKPYKEGARGPDFFDCYGLAIEVAKRMGHKVPDLFELASEDPHNLEFATKSEGLVKTETPAFGDVVLFFDSKGRIYHCGIVLKNGEMIHCTKERVHIMKISEYKKKGEYYTWQQ
jgi:cell wall-associated NlpC family hydrolase